MHYNGSKINRLYCTHIERFIPQYAFFSLAGCFVFNCLIYFITQNLMANSYHYDMTTSLDKAWPFVPEWVLIYVLSYIFWVGNYALVAKFNSKEKWFRFVTADLFSRVVCGVIFILLPTTNMRPDVVGDGVLDYMMRFIYWVDKPYNLFPSIHCLASWLSYIGIRGNKEIPKWYRGFSLVFALMICLSTQFTKQHYVADFISGIILAELCFALMKKIDLYVYVERFYQWLNRKVFGFETDEGQENTL